MRIFNGFDEIKSAAGSEIGVSDWIEITQDRIVRFAETTCDNQWIHIDEDRRPSFPAGRISLMVCCRSVSHRCSSVRSWGCEASRIR